MSYFEKLQKRVNSPSSKVSSPEVIDSDFLSETEINDVKEKVYRLKNYWEYLGEQSPDLVPARMLPLGRYSRHYLEYRKKYTPLQSILLENFSAYYQRIKQKIQLHFNVAAEFHKDASLPGFHIFILDEYQTEAIYPYYNFHQDWFNFPEMKLEKIFSFVIPISVPSVSTGLIYTLDRTNKRTEIDKDCRYNFLEYKPGSLIKWEGNLTHSIAPFSLTKEESRITIQFHVNLTKSSAYIFW